MPTTDGTAADVAQLLAELDRLRDERRQGLEANALLAARVVTLEAELLAYGRTAEECTRLRVRVAELEGGQAK